MNEIDYKLYRSNSSNSKYPDLILKSDYFLINKLFDVDWDVAKINSIYCIKCGDDQTNNNGRACENCSFQLDQPANVSVNREVQKETRLWPDLVIVINSIIVALAGFFGVLMLLVSPSNGLFFLFMAGILKVINMILEKRSATVNPYNTMKMLQPKLAEQIKSNNMSRVIPFHETWG